MASNTSLNITPKYNCLSDRASMYIFASFTGVTLLLLPLSVFVLYLGFVQWKRRRPASHLDHFTYHMAAMEVIPICGSVLFFLGLYYQNQDLLHYSISLFSPTWSAKLHFNSFTCVERYLAVVHPIKYLGLKRRGGVKIRNCCIGSLWLLALCWSIISSFCFVSDGMHIVVFLFSLSLAFTVIAFCNLSVLCALIHPSPAKGGRKKVRVDQSKKRAFQTVSIVFGMLLFGAVGMMTCETVSLTTPDCTLYNVGVWFTLPCSLVLPLLFLHRFGRFLSNTEAKLALK